MFFIDNETRTTDKFDMAKFIDFDTEGLFNTLNSFMLYQIPKLQEAGWHTIRKEECHPEYLSYTLYGSLQYWWILMLYNGLLNPKDLKVGLKIKYPNLAAIEQLYLQASINQKAKE
jgi:hypothetical protein